MIDKIRPSRVEIDLRALRHNIALVRKWAGEGSKLMAVVKANAYGHGAVKISEAAAQEEIDFLGVALLEEACELQDAGIKTPIVILYPEENERSAEAVRRGFHVTISDIRQYEAVARMVEGRSVNFFIKVESGMNRYGMPEDEINDILQLREKIPNSQVLGITTNLAEPSKDNSPLARKQVESFLRTMGTLQRHSQNGLYYSLESSGTLWKNRGAEGTLVRVGHLLYGLVPGTTDSGDLEPVMSVKSRLAEIHHVKPEEGVGYGFSFIARRESIIGTVPMGYADGYPWSLSNKGHVLIRGRRAPVVGRVCMDAFMVDITDIAETNEGDEVVVLGKMGKEKIDAHELGRLAGSFSYEILSRWSRRLPRIYL